MCDARCRIIRSTLVSSGWIVVASPVDGTRQDGGERALPSCHGGSLQVPVAEHASIDRVGQRILTATTEEGHRLH